MSDLTEERVGLFSILHEDVFFVVLSNLPLDDVFKLTLGISKGFTVKCIPHVLNFVYSLGGWEIFEQFGEIIRKGVIGVAAIYFRAHNQDKKLLTSNSFIFPFLCEFGFEDLVKYYLDNQLADPGACENYAINLAAKNGHTEVVKMLVNESKVRRNTSINLHVNTCAPLRVACQNGHAEIARLLIEAGCDPTLLKNDCLNKAAANGHREVVELLLEYSNVHPSDQGYECIILAMERGHINVAKILLKDHRVNRESYRNTLKKFSKMFLLEIFESIEKNLE